jgi:hypothetical protein
MWICNRAALKATERPCRAMTISVMMAQIVYFILLLAEFINTKVWTMIYCVLNLWQSVA